MSGTNEVKSLLEELQEVDETIDGDYICTPVNHGEPSPFGLSSLGGDCVCDTHEYPNVIPMMSSNSNMQDTKSPLDNITIVDDNFSCLICKDLLCEPVVLLCQHAYCYECLKDFHKSKTKQLTDYWEPVPVGGTDAGTRCPCCKFPFTVPPKYNHEYELAIEKLFPDQYATRKSEIRLKEKKDKLIEQMRKEVWNMISEKPPLQHEMTNFRELIAQPIGYNRYTGGRFRTEVLASHPLDDEDLFAGMPLNNAEEQKRGREFINSVWRFTKAIVTNPLVLTLGAVYLSRRTGMI